MEVCDFNKAACFLCAARFLDVLRNIMRLNFVFEGVNCYFFFSLLLISWITDCSVIFEGHN